MVFVKVRETYDLHTLRNKMSVIGIHTPKADIIRRNYPGLLMQCKMYRPVSCDVRLACASMLPLDPQGVGLTEGDVAPEDIFNPILYKAVSNKGMDLIEKFINSGYVSYTEQGDSVDATNAGLTEDDFDIYYGLLANTHGWKHASPQSGLSMNGLRPLVYEVLYTEGDDGADASGVVVSPTEYAIMPDGTPSQTIGRSFRGSAKPMPFINCLTVKNNNGSIVSSQPGFVPSEESGIAGNYNLNVPSPKIYCGVLCIPPSRLHQLFYRLVCEWTIEFTGIRSIQEITSFVGLARIGGAQHIMSYDFGGSKLLSDETTMVDTTEGSEIKRVM